MKRILHICYIIGFVLALAACSSTKYVGEGEYLLDAVEIKVDDDNFKSADLKSYLHQQPNFKVFWLMKWQLYIYGWSGKSEKNWFNRQLRKMGEPPVILDTTLVDQSIAELKRFCVNKGYVNADVTASIDTTKRKKAVVTYNITANEPYRIRNYAMQLDDPKIDSLARQTPPPRHPILSAFRPTPEGYTSLVKEGGLFDRDDLDKERQRITNLLRRQGYYAFHKDYLAYMADSSFNQNVVDVDMLLKPYRQLRADGSVVDTCHHQYYIKSVKVVTDYNAISEEDESRFMLTDSVRSRDIDILYGKGGRSVRPGVLRKSTYLIPGQLYNERAVEHTYSSFARLRALKNVNIRFTEVEENDTMKLNCFILTSPAKLQSFGVDLEGTNSAGDLGFASSLNYQHRNLFKGAEIFSARIRGAYESLSGRGTSGLGSYWEFGSEASVRFPRFLFPFLSYKFRRMMQASTELKVSYNRQSRPEYERSILSGAWSYIWQSRTNSQARHIFKMFDVDYVYLPHVDPAFRDSLPEVMALYNYSNQFILGVGYTYMFNNYSPQNRQRNTHSLRVSLEMAGNMLNAISHISGANKNQDGLYELFGIPYAQFAKVDVDFSKGWVLDRRNRLAFHIGGGVAVPYGNADLVPFERRYFSGGANSVRGWSVRELGPGSMYVTDNTSFAMQVGDIRLDVNLEYRTKLFWKFEMAAYLDAGNIWTIRQRPEFPNGNFDFSRFYKEIAFSYGLGLRLDFDFFLLRFDTGMKAYNPQERGSRRWAFLHPNFTDNFAWHFAVGYPF